MAPKDVDIIAKESPFEGFFRIDRYRLRHGLFAGGLSDEITREIFERGHAVGILLYDPDADKLIFGEQFRTGALAAAASGWFGEGFSPWLTEVPAGMIDPGENPAEVAHREVMEETGCEILDLVPITHYLASPGGSSESIFVFCGRVKAPNDGEIHGLAEETEDIRLRVVRSEEALGWLEDGTANNALILIALQWFALHRDELRTRWSEAP